MKFGMRVAIGVFVTSLAGALFVIKDAGKMEIAEEAGRFLAKESCFCLWNGQEGRYVLAELLGGQSYFEPNQALAESDAGKEKLAVVENRELQEGQIPKPSEPLIGDVEEEQPAVGGKHATRTMVTMTKDDVKIQHPDTVKYLFTTSTCPNCRMAKKMLEGEDLEIIDAEKNPDMARQFGIMQAPTLVITDGEHLKKYVNASNIQKYVDEELDA